MRWSGSTSPHTHLGISGQRDHLHTADPQKSQPDSQRVLASFAPPFLFVPSPLGGVWLIKFRCVGLAFASSGLIKTGRNISSSNTGRSHTGRQQPQMLSYIGASPPTASSLLVQVVAHYTHFFLLCYMAPDEPSSSPPSTLHLSRLQNGPALLPCKSTTSFRPL